MARSWRAWGHPSPVVNSALGDFFLGGLGKPKQIESAKTCETKKRLEGSPLEIRGSSTTKNRFFFQPPTIDLKHQKKGGCQHQMRNFSQQSWGFNNNHWCLCLVRPIPNNSGSDGTGDYLKSINCTLQSWLIKASMVENSRRIMFMAF